MDSAGRAPDNELPTMAFGLTPNALPIEREIGYRTGFTGKERDISTHIMQKQQENDLRNDPSIDEGKAKDFIW